MAFDTLSKAACCARGIRKFSDRSKNEKILDFCLQTLTPTLSEVISESFLVRLIFLGSHMRSYVIIKRHSKFSKNSFLKTGILEF